MSSLATEKPPGTAIRSRPNLLYSRWLLVALLLAGLVIRILVIRTSWGVPDADEATGMLMAQRAAHGHFAVFFWGANYGGALITWVEALFVWIFGLHIVIFQIVDTILALVAALFLRAIASRFMSGWASDLAAGLCWMLPPVWMYWSAREYVFWMPGMVFALLTVLCIIRWTETKSTRFAYLVGFFLGVTYWLYPLYLVLVAVPAALFVWVARRDWRVLVRSAVMVPVGGVFWILANVRHGLESLHQPIASHQSFSVIVKHSVTQVLPAAVSALPSPGGPVASFEFPGYTAMKWLGVGVMLAAAVWVAAFLLAGRVRLSAIGACVLCWPLAVGLSGVLAGRSGYRYGLVIVPLLALMVAWLAGRSKALVIVVAAAVVATSVLATGSATRWFEAEPPCTNGITQVSHFLEAAGRTHVYASYWAAAPLDVCSGDHIIASSTVVQRDTYAAARVESASRATFVVFAGNLLDQALASWQAENPHAGALRRMVGGFAIWELQHRASPQSLGLPASTF